MKKYKICVYAISKNEEKFVERWVKSMSEADKIFVLDTGSTDNTVRKLKELGVNVEIKNFLPWRFDTARNESLKLVDEDTDICVCTDIDEVFEKGWRKKLEENWSNDTTRCRYSYYWSLDDKDRPKVSFFIEKIHKRFGYSWTHPVHEVLKYNGNENIITIKDILLKHYPDSSKSRSSYLPLLELSTLEDPTDDRNMHYLGREYMYYGKWNEAIDTLIKHLSLEKATWKDERAASMRYIARSYKNLKRYDEARMWLDKSMNEAPYLRDAYVERGILEYELNNYSSACIYLEKALEIKDHTMSYIHEVFSWNETIYDLLSICYYNLGEFKKSYNNVCIANELNPDDTRIKENKKIIYNKIKKEEI